MSDPVAQALAHAAARWRAEATLARWRGPDAVGGGADATAAADDPRPGGWQRCDPSWIEAALADLDPVARAIVVGDRRDPLARWLARRTLGHLVAMPPPGPAVGLERLPRLTGRGLARTLSVLGRRQLAHAVGGATAAELTALAARLPWGGDLGGEVAAVRGLGAAATGELGSRRSAAARTRGLPWHTPGAAVTAGARALAPAIAGRPLAWQLAQRLPRPIGLEVLAELTGPFARAPADGVGAAELERAIDRGSVGP